MSDEISELKEEEQEKLEQEMEPEEEDWSKSEWVIGAALIVVGIVLLASNLFEGLGFVSNWWAFFIFIPAVINLNQAWQSYRSHGRLTEKAQGKLVGGLLIGTVGFILLFGFSFSTWWPVFLIIIGLGALLKVRG